MNTEIKRHIDSARQVLVGVVPNPTSQIDQITTALIYKFMDDMDQSAIKVGGDPSFFTGELEKYSWTKLMDTRIGNQERMNLYVEALSHFAESKKLPELFRGIFKSAFLPYRSPDTLGLFLKEINYFDYSHPEDLGDAYEYLLSIMSSQGDAGQFRTPRHIIDFMVDVVDPGKDDRILDPACGTAGFLIKSYLHILEKHDGKDDPEHKEKPLTPDERRKLLDNFEGYDIDPGMVRIAQVNMYLHQFKNPRIYQYDSLTQEDRWNDKFDVILANPPFMSPKGGIKPHQKFSIQSSRSEVLFVDYIMNHLKPRGRAAIIVPEGIIFQSGTAYKQLRNNLLEDGLYAVVSLPSGVFAPYSGVKTSILLLNNELAKQRSEILFVKIENDGFDLGATKRPISKNDLPRALETLNKWNTGEKVENKLALYAKKAKITENGDYNLSGDSYRIATDYSNAKWPMVEFEDVVSTVTPPIKIAKNDFQKSGSFPIIDQSQDEIAGWTNDESSLVRLEKPAVIFGDHTCVVKYSEKNFAQGADGIKILLTNDRLIPKYLYYLLKTKPIESEGYQRHFAKLKKYKIPLPTLEIQEQIVTEIDGYQKIIDGAKQFVDSWKPRIDIDSKWERVKLGDVCKLSTGTTPDTTNKSYYVGNNPFIKTTDIDNNVINNSQTQISDEAIKKYNLKKFPEGTILMAMYGQGKTRGRVSYLKINASTTQNAAAIQVNDTNKILDKYLYYLLATNYEKLRDYGIQGHISHLNLKLLGVYEVPLPSMEIQDKIVKEIEEEKLLVESVKKLIDSLDKRIKQTVNKVWENG